MEEIRFYDVNDPFGFFSTFSFHPIFLNGERWNTVQHYFQARKNIVRNDWEVIKEQVMYNALRCKFLQHPKLLKELLMTKDCLIIHHTENDNYWGDGGDGTGRNRLGILLMNIRSEVAKDVDDMSMIFPPWIAFPAIDQLDMFWQMGLGEDYLMQWFEYLPSTDQKKYKEKFPEPAEWEGVYD